MPKITIHPAHPTYIAMIYQEVSFGFFLGYNNSYRGGSGGYRPTFFNNRKSQQDIIDSDWYYLRHKTGSVYESIYLYVYLHSFMIDCVYMCVKEW